MLLKIGIEKPSKMENSYDEEREMIKEPFLKNSSKGGLRTMPFIIANGMLERTANYGLSPNMALFLMGQYHMEMTVASSILFYWSSATYFMPVIGAIIADSYVGRYNMIGIGSVVNVLGMTLLWLTAVVPGVSPPPCDESVNHCSSATIPQLLLLCTSFAIIAIGGGFIRSSSLAFGVDQLENQDNSRKGGLPERYFSWYYATCTFSVLVAFTCVVYLQDKMGWGFGFGVSLVLMVISAVSFFLGTSFYVKVNAKASFVTELIQVIVASWKKRHIQVSGNDSMIFHHQRGSVLFFPSEKLRFLNKASTIEDPQQELTPDGRARDPWSLCTVDQVEDIKALLKVTPLWSTGVLTFVTMSQGSFSVLQASSMNRKVSANFEVPAGSFGTFSVISLVLWIPIYDRLILPSLSRISGKPTHFSAKQRMGAGIFLSCVCMIVTALVEGFRRSLANKAVAVRMSALWLVPQYCLIGIAEGFNAIAQNEFYIAEFPKSMSSTASTLSTVGASVGTMLASFLMSTIDGLTKREGQQSWVSTDINKGHYDYYFWVLFGLSLVNFMYFLLCCRIYGPCRCEEEKAREEEGLLS